jgi:hypothetical protein
MADIVTDTFNYIQTGKIANIPVIYFFILIGLVIFVVYLLITRKPKQKEYKPINLKKEIKDELKTYYKFFSMPVRKPVYSGLINIGYAIGYMPLVWNKQMKQLIANKRRTKVPGSKEVIADKNALSDEMQYEHVDLGKENIVELNERTPIGSYAKIVNQPIEMFCFKVCSNNMLSKILAQFLNVGITYFFIEESFVKIDQSSIQFSPFLQRQYFFGQFIFSKIGRDVIDNTAFRIDRENVLQETANQIPRTVFFDTELAKGVARMREVASIEKDRFKSQKESAED